MPRPRPLYTGFLQPLTFVPLMAALLSYLLRDFPPPSAESMYAVAGVGITIVLGYVIEVVWMVGRLQRVGAEREDWIGGMVGLGACGLGGVVVALLVAAHREAGHSNRLDSFGLWYVVVSLGLLGIMVSLQPLIVERWTHETGEPAARLDELPVPRPEA